jgi:hypothetical protein
VVLVAGCELTLFGTGFLPGATFPARMTGLQALFDTLAKASA